MADLYGYTGKILMIDLSSNNITTLDTADYLPEWVGGRGIGAKIHWDMVGPDVGAYDPENVLSFMTGAGTGIVDTRTVVQGVSPLGYPKECYYRSTIGSHFGAELKHAGWDGIVLTGKAPQLSILVIQNDNVQVMPAGDLYQMDTYSTEYNLWARFGNKCRMLIIGPAGENMVADAIIQGDDHNATGIGGFGGVMGSKNMKAIVVRGTLDSPQIYNVPELMDLRLQEADLMVPNPGVGAAAGSEIELAGKSGLARVGVAGCFGCQQPCGYSIKYHDGKSVAMGSIKCGEFICSQAELEQTGEYVGRNHYIRVAQQGLLGLSGQPSYKRVIQNDVDGYYDEPLTCVHEGYVTEEDLGIPYKYGTPEFTDMFNRIIAYRQGVGNELAKGQPRFCNEYLGTPEAIHDFEINSMRKGMHGFGVGFYIHLYRTCGMLCRATSTVNSGDQRGMYHYLFPSYEPFAANATEVGAAMANWEWTYTAQGVKFMQDFKASMDLVDRCFFNLGADSMGAHQRLFERIHTAITGDDYGPEAEQEAVDRLWVLERSILARQGHTRDDDMLCDSVFEEYGRYSENVNEANFLNSLEEYYGMRNVDPATGQVRKSEYERLGLSDVAQELETRYGVVLPE